MTKFVLFLFTAISLSSCISLVNYQTGKTLGKDNNEIIVSSEVFPVSDNEVSVAYSPGISYYRGVSDKVDVGIRVESGLFGYSAGAKIQLVGDQSSRFALAIDPRVGILLLPEKNYAPYAVLPAIVSWHPSEKFALTFAEEFYYLSADDRPTDLSHSLGMEIGENRVLLSLGATYGYYGLNSFVYGIGGKIRF